MATAREIPEAWRESVERHIRTWLAGHPRLRNTRQQAAALGMKQPTLVQLLNRRGSLGLHLLIQVRNGIGVPLDDLLNLPPLGATALSAEELDRIRALLREHRDNPPAEPEPRPSRSPRKEHRS